MSKVQFLKRFDPYDGATTTVNPKLVTLPGGAVQTSTTEKPFDDVKTTSTTLRTTPITTTTYRPIIKTTPYRPIEIKTTSYRPIGITTTPYRPIEIRTTTYRPPVKLNSAAATHNKPFNVFDFYRTLYNPTKPPPLSNTLKPFVVKRPQYQAPPPPPPAPSSSIFNQKPVVSQPFQQNIIPSAPVLRVEPKPVAVIPSPIIPARVSTINELKAGPAVVPSAHPVQTLEKNVAPPLAANHQKATLSPRVNVQLVDSGHKFINRFVVDEDTIREDGLLPVKTRLDKDVVAPPVNNVRPILSPKISVHVGDTGYKFINRFVLTDDEQKEQYGTSGKSLIKGAPTRTAVNPGQTAFTSRFDVDDVNKKLFQIKSVTSEPQQVRAPQSQILFNNRFDEGVNHFHYQTQDVGRANFGRTLDKQPVVGRFNSQFTSFKKTYH